MNTNASSNKPPPVATGVVAAQPPSFLPLALVDKCIGSRIQVLMRNSRELLGILRGFDDYFNMVLDDVTEYTFEPTLDKKAMTCVKTTPGAVLLNGSNVAMLVPCGNPPPPDLYQGITDVPRR